MDISQLDPLAKTMLMMGFCTVVVLLIAWICGIFNTGTYHDVIHSCNRYHVTKTYMSGATHEYEVERIVIKRFHGNGKIEFIEKEVKI
jgi:hypothetical protein